MTAAFGKSTYGNRSAVTQYRQLNQEWWLRSSLRKAGERGAEGWHALAVEGHAEAERRGVDGPRVRALLGRVLGARHGERAAVPSVRVVAADVSAFHHAVHHLLVAALHGAVCAGRSARVVTIVAAAVWAARGLLGGRGAHLLSCGCFAGS